MVEIISAIGGQADFSSLQARIWRNQAVFQAEGPTLPELFQHDMPIQVRITSMKPEKNQMEATITRAFQAWAEVPQAASGKMGRLIGAGGKNIQQLQSTTHCWINIHNESNGSSHLQFASNACSNIEQARLVVNQIITELVWLGDKPPGESDLIR
jgi:hypothetical protein